jgi:hypothetical protein
MQVANNQSSKQMLEKLSQQKENGEYDPEVLYKYEKEIEDNMEEFDLEKRKKAAQAAEDLGKLVITA